MKSKKTRPFKFYFLICLVAAIVVFAALQIESPKINNLPITSDFKAPANVKAIMQRACYDCHSNNTHLSWFDKIAPVSWRVAAHIREGRESLNFSEWNKLAPVDQKAKLWECINQINAGAMPLKDYEFVHTSAKVSAQDLIVLKDYLTGMTGNKPNDTTKLNARDKQYILLKNDSHSLQTHLPKALNGIAFIPDYKNWQPISTTDRFDNGTMRVIFGNKVAIAAIKNHQINPWPKGTIFAKVAWDQVADDKGSITTGAFKQIEFMIKDEEKFSSTHGWGFARFKTPKLIPYGKTVMFTNECINCHRPLGDNDFVFTQPIQH